MPSLGERAPGAAAGADRRVVELVLAEAFAAARAVDERIGEVLEMAGCRPDSRRAENGGIEADHVVNATGVFADRLPPEEIFEEEDVPRIAPSLQAALDNANPGDAVRVAEELVSREKVDMLAGTFLSNTGLAVTDFAKQKKFFFLGGAGSCNAMDWIQEGEMEATVLYPPTQAADGIRLARLLAQDKGMSDLVQVSVPRRIVLDAPVVTADNVDQYMQFGFS